MATKTKSLKNRMRCTVELSLKDLKRALERGEFTGVKITKMEWQYRSVMVDPGRGNPEFNDVVSGVAIDFVENK